jgi:hypothetical protein
MRRRKLSAAHGRREVIPRQTTMTRYASAGDRFGRLTIIDPNRRLPLTAAERSRGVTKGRHALLVRCDCGVEKLVKAWNVASGVVVSCGCQRAERQTQTLHDQPLRRRRPGDITITLAVGQRFGRLTVVSPDERLPLTDKQLRRDPRRIVGTRAALVRCTCGTEKLVSVHELHRGTTNSCGCLKRERAAERVRARAAFTREHRPT